MGKWSYSCSNKYEFLIWILAQMFKQWYNTRVIAVIRSSINGAAFIIEDTYCFDILAVKCI